MNQPSDTGGSAFGWEFCLIATLVGLFVSGFFSGCETGLMSVSRIRLRRAWRHGRDHRAFLLERLLPRLEEGILTCLIGTNLFNVMVPAFITLELTARYGERGELYATALASGLVIIFGEILPKVTYREFPERLTMASVRTLLVSMWLLAPVRVAMRAYSGLWRRMLPESGEGQSESLDRSRLASLLVAGDRSSDQDRRFDRTLKRFLQLARQPVRRFARPFEELITVDITAALADCLVIAARSGFSRLPVLSESDGRLMGYYLVRELMFAAESADTQQPPPEILLRSFLRVDASLTPYELFEDFRSQRQQVAAVVGDDGRTRGLVTLEDLLEAVIGSIEDEFDAAADLPGGV